MTVQWGRLRTSLLSSILRRQVFCDYWSALLLKPMLVSRSFMGWTTSTSASLPMGAALTNCGGADSDSEASWEPAPVQDADMDDPRWLLCPHGHRQPRDLQMLLIGPDAIDVGVGARLLRNRVALATGVAPMIYIHTLRAGRDARAYELVDVDVLYNVVFNIVAQCFGQLP
jgi:hypothetical protein